MKKLIRLKTLHLILYLLFLLICTGLFVLRPDSFHQIANDPLAGMLAGMLLLSLLLSMLFTFWDLLSYDRQKRHLYSIFYVNTDRESLPNPTGAGGPLMDYDHRGFSKNMAAILYEAGPAASSGRTGGKASEEDARRNFSILLKLAAEGRIPLAADDRGRFLVFFEETTPEELDRFIRRISDQVAQNNAEPDRIPLRVKSAVYFRDPEFAANGRELLGILDGRLSSSDSR